MNKIIAVGGLKNSGKNEVSNMLEFILNTPNWAHKYWIFKYLNILKYLKYNYKITSFAFPLKRTLSALLDVDIELFDNRNFKENYYIYFPKLEITKDPNSNMIISDNKFNKLLSNKDFSFLQENYITFRQLLQVFGTECMRNLFGNKIWILSTLKDDSDLIISDLRFQIEYEEIKKNNGITIYINRKECSPGLHSSEQEIYRLFKNNKFDYIIENNGSLKDLFNKLIVLKF